MNKSQFSSPTKKRRHRRLSGLLMGTLGVGATLLLLGSRGVPSPAAENPTSQTPPAASSVVAQAVGVQVNEACRRRGQYQLQDCLRENTWRSECPVACHSGDAICLRRCWQGAKRWRNMCARRYFLTLRTCSLSSLPSSS